MTQSVAENTRWIAASSVVCKPSSGQIATRSVQMTVVERLATSSRLFSYDANLVSKAVRSNAAGTGSISVTLVGSMLGIDAVTIQTRFGQTRTESTRWISDSIITSSISSSAGRSRLIAVTSHDNDGTASALFSYSLLKVSSIRATGNLYNVNITQENLKVAGSIAYHLGTCRAELAISWCAQTDKPLEVSVGDSKISCPSDINHTCQNCSLPYLILPFEALVQRFAYLEDRNASLISIGSLSCESQSTVPSDIRQRELTSCIQGTSQNSVIFYGSACTFTEWSSPSSLLCKTAIFNGIDYSGTPLSFVFSTNVHGFRYGLPRDGSNIPHDMSIDLIVTGSLLAIKSLTPFMSIGFTQNERTIWNSESNLVSKSSIHAFSTRKMTITNIMTSSTSSESLSYDVPILLQVVSFEESTTGSYEITLLGTGFGSQNRTGLSTLTRVGFTPCENSLWNSDTSILCFTPAGVHATQRIIITTGIRSSSLTESFSFERPILDDIIPGNAACTGRMSITIVGSNYGQSDYSGRPRIGGTACEAARWTSDSSIVCKLAAGFSSNRWVEVSVGVRKSAPLFSLFTYIDNIGSYQIWINGAFTRKCSKYSNACGWTGAIFGLQENKPGTPFSAACSGADGKWPPTDVASLSCSQLDCALGSCTSNSTMRSDFPMTRSFSYDAPVIFHPSTQGPSRNSAFGSGAGGWLMTIIGRNFGFYADIVNVSVSNSIYDNPEKSISTGRYLHGKSVCRIPCTPGAEANGVWQSYPDEFQCDGDYRQGAGNKWMSDSHIICIMPAGVGLMQDLTVAIGSAAIDGPSPVPSMRYDTQYGQSHVTGSSLASSDYTGSGMIQVHSAQKLFGSGVCKVDGVVHPSLYHCASDTDCKSYGICTTCKVVCETAGTISISPPQSQSIPTVAGIEYALVTAVDFSSNKIAVDPWSVPPIFQAESVLYRPPGINVLPSDSQLDQIAFSPNAFSYSRPVVHKVVPRFGPVRRSRQITVHGLNFGLKKDYIPKGLHIRPLEKYVARVDGNVQGLLPIRASIPSQKFSSTGDKEFLICSPLNSACPLNQLQGAYINWQLSVYFPNNQGWDIRKVTGYQDYTVTLDESLRNKPECDGQYGCPQYVLNPLDPRTLSFPTYNYYDKFHPFPGWCGQHLVRVEVDGQMSIAREQSRENMNEQSLVYFDDKPHVVSVAMFEDGTGFQILFDTQTCHGNDYRSRPYLRSDVFSSDCNPTTVFDSIVQEDCNRYLRIAAVVDGGLKSGERVKTDMTSGFDSFTVNRGGWGCTCGAANSARTVVNCSYIYANDPSGVGFVGIVQARPCPIPCSLPTKDPVTGLYYGEIVSVLILRRGTGHNTSK
eukprot:766414-Hanusia_phi.AAC.3